MNPRQETLLRKLAARTYRDGRPKAQYEQNVANIKAELAAIEEATKHASRTPS